MATPFKHYLKQHFQRYFEDKSKLEKSAFYDQLEKETGYCRTSFIHSTKRENPGIKLFAFVSKYFDIPINHLMMHPDDVTILCFKNEQEEKNNNVNMEVY